MPEPLAADRMSLLTVEITRDTLRRLTKVARVIDMPPSHVARLALAQFLNGNAIVTTYVSGDVDPALIAALPKGTS